MPIQIHTVESQPFAENSYTLWVPGNTEAVVIDPGFEPEVLLEFLAEQGLTLAAILNTHGHVDHIAGNRAMKEAFPDAPIVIGHGDAEMLVDPDLNLSGPFGIPVTSPPRDRAVRDGDELQYAGIHLTCWELPGHSPGHVVFYAAGQSPPILLGGDVLFRDGVGRWDFPGGDFDTLKRGIEAKLWPLPADTVVYPGHGPTTTVGREKRANPFVGAGK